MANFTKTETIKVPDYIFMKSPLEPLLLLLAYFLFVYRIGPKFMEKRQPFQLKYTMLCYNLLQIVLNALLFTQLIPLIPKVDVFCTTFQHLQINVQEALKLQYFYFLLKVLDLMDTVFFVLKKKMSHVSLLHVYHHAGMVVAVWSLLNICQSAHAIFGGLMNLPVHVILYSYYFLTIINPAYKEVWWKKYITQIQLVQLAFGVLFVTLPLLDSNCDIPKIGLILLMPNHIFLLFLFLKFYTEAYCKKEKISD